jgi:hypothetical protein
MQLIHACMGRQIAVFAPKIHAGMRLSTRHIAHLHHSNWATGFAVFLYAWHTTRQTTVALPGEGMIVNKLALAAALALTFSGTAHAKAIALEPAPASPSPPSARVLDASLAPDAAPVVPPRGMSELPEPEVFAMMLVGLVLIGYRASRDSSEKFK